MFNSKENQRLTARVKELTDQKWDAIGIACDHIGTINRKLFDEIQLALSGIEGKLKFATGTKVWDKDQPQIEDDFTRNVVNEAKEKVNETRKALTAIMQELRDVELHKVVELDA